MLDGLTRRTDGVAIYVQWGEQILAAIGRGAAEAGLRAAAAREREA